MQQFEVEEGGLEVPDLAPEAKGVEREAPRELLTIRDLVKRYGENTVLDGVSISASAGQIVGIIGKNGAGKSTLIESALGLRPFQSGEVLIDGIDITKEPQKAKQYIGYSPSEPIAYDSMTGAEYLAYTASIYGMDPAQAEADANRLLEALGLPSSMYNKPFALCSHGTQQKICLVASIIHRPLIWILDEPTVGLDVIAYRALLKIMREYADEGHAIVIVTHDMELVRAICDQIFILRGARLVREEESSSVDLATEIESEESA